MSSPTINFSNANSGNTSLSTIMDLVRSLVNDTQAGATGTPGEGQVFTNNPSISPFTQPFLNSAIRELYRELRNVGQPTLIKDNIIVSGLTPVNGPNGLGMPDPAIQTYLGFGGYFDGLTINGNLVLPSDVLYMEKVWERQTNTNNNFVPVYQEESGLPSRAQQPTLAQWEWRNDNINFVGSTQTNDIRMRYWCALPQFFSATLDFDSTFVPILDCTDAVAYKTAVKYAVMLGSPGLADLRMEAKEQMYQMKNANVRRSQMVDYQRQPYGSYGNSDTSNSFFLGWQ